MLRDLLHVSTKALPSGDHTGGVVVCGEATARNEEVAFEAIALQSQVME